MKRASLLFDALTNDSSHLHRIIQNRMRDGSISKSTCPGRERDDDHHHPRTGSVTHLTLVATLIDASRLDKGKFQLDSIDNDVPVMLEQCKLPHRLLNTRFEEWRKRGRQREETSREATTHVDLKHAKDIAFLWNILLNELINEHVYKRNDMGMERNLGKSSIEASRKPMCKNTSNRPVSFSWWWISFLSLFLVFICVLNPPARNDCWLWDRGSIYFLNISWARQTHTETTER